MMTEGLEEIPGLIHYNVGKSNFLSYKFAYNWKKFVIEVRQGARLNNTHSFASRLLSDAGASKEPTPTAA